MKKLNYVQTRLAQAFKKNIFAGLCDRGIFCAPTGTGKTGTARAMINLYAHKFVNTGEGAGFSFFLTPRIALTEQQALALVDFHILDADYPDVEILTHNVHSNSADDYRARADLEEAINSAKEQNKYLVFCSTYQSARYMSGLKPDLIICDEAHNVVGDEFYETVMHYLHEGSPRVFLTATPKEVEGQNTQGFNNSKMYGEFLAQVAPRRAIEERLIVPPRLHVFYANSPHTQYETVVSQIIHSFDTHKNFNLALPAKVLYVMAGTEPIDVARQHWEEIYNRTGAWVFTIVSTGDFPGAFINGRLVDREEFFNTFVNHAGAAIMCHCRIVGEGIDLPSLTGVVLMRNTELIATVQSVGRALRLHSADRDAFGVGLNIEHRIKKHALVTVTVFNDNTEIQDNVGKIVKEMRKAGFDYFRERILITHEKSNSVPDDGTPSMHDDEETHENSKIQFELEKMMSELEEAEYMNMESAYDKNPIYEYVK